MSEKKEYIERGALMKRLNGFNDHVNGNEHFLYGIQTARDLLESTPTADVEPVVRGEWIDHYDECECPVCGETWKYCDNDTDRFDCCPKCGARLVEHGKER